MTASRAGTRNKAIGKELAGLFIVKLGGCFFDEIALGMEFKEKIGGRFMVDGCRSPGIIIEGNPEGFKGGFNHPMVLVYQFFWRNPFFFCLHGDGYPVFITPADKGYFFPPESQVAHINIRRDIDPCQVPDMNRSVGIGKGCCYGIAGWFFRHQE